MDKYQIFATQIRTEALKMVCRAKASHIGGALSMADILSVLYSDILQIDPQNPDACDRDRFILSKGHACTALYATLALKGFFPMEELSTYGQDNSRLMSHTNHKVPGVELSTGSLGHAFPVSCGLAYAARIKQETWKTYCLLSDGELDEGSNWEAFMFAAHHHLHNLTAIIDYNKIQAMGNTNEVICLEPLEDKLNAFGWNVISIDGHNYEIIEAALLQPTTKPKAVIAHTIKGKGVDFMENSLLWHYRNPTEEQLAEALAQLQIQNPKS
ncbi:MAG: transketolase [Dysgonamonadaceae bacterium]|jgi:transketolase|nr:transketolase [Dysgonamonadaceae bacterium]